jgi:site-specific DNA recombinase
MNEERAMKKAVGYIRVSTEGQVTDGVSLDTQRAKIEAWCLANDFELSGLFVDAGLSGSRADNRPELQNALSAVTTYKGALIVYSLSRLARSTKDTIAMSERLSKAGADLVSLSEKIDTTSAAGRMVFQMLAVLAEFERNQISERTTAAMAHMRIQGRFLGQLPFGYDLATDGENLVPNNLELEAIRLMQSLRAEGHSLRTIAARLESTNILTKAGNSHWTHTAVQSILKRAA